MTFIPNHQKQTCKACGIPDGFDFNVSNDMWNRIVPEHLRKLVICLRCFDFFAKEKGISYANDLSELYFAGEQAVFSFKKETSSCANNNPNWEI